MSENTIGIVHFIAYFITIFIIHIQYICQQIPVGITIVHPQKLAFAVILKQIELIHGSTRIVMIAAYLISCVIIFWRQVPVRHSR